MEHELISIIQALEDLSHNRFVRFLYRHWGWMLASGIVIFILLSLFALSFLVVFLLGIPLVVFLVLIAYLVSHGHFVARVNRNKPLCGSCKSLVWQVRCSCCKQPVPVLVLLLKGLLLAHCPHCGCSLGPGNKNLQGWCSSCFESFPAPHLRFSIPTTVHIELGCQLPQHIPEGWEVKGNSKFIELHRSDNKAYTIHYSVTHEPDSFQCIPGNMYEYARKIWIGKDINPRVRDVVLDTIPIITRRKIELFFEDVEVSNCEALEMRGFRKIFIGKPGLLTSGTQETGKIKKVK